MAKRLLFERSVKERCYLRNHDWGCNWSISHWYNVPILNDECPDCAATLDMTESRVLIRDAPTGNEYRPWTPAERADWWRKMLEDGAVIGERELDDYA